MNAACALLLVSLCGTSPALLAAQEASPVLPILSAPCSDARFTHFRTIETTYEFPTYASLEAWQARREHLRRHILVSCGLWPLPERTPLKPVIFGRLERDGYTVEKAYFESYPGFYVTGNLYRPTTSGKHPAVANPHGHWGVGRLANEESGSLPGRCISQARQGYVAFSYDMVGYNDSKQVPHDFGGERENLWGLSLMGLQLWDSIRVVDFLASLPDADPDRIACTGESGGGTQTYLLTAVDDRVKVASPVNMVSAHYQGGCLCENAPLLRLDAYNVEFAAMAAPRPLLLVSCTGDWTVNTPRVEFPAAESIYRLYGVPDHVAWVQMDAGHNYNRESREAVYGWLGKWLLGKPTADPVPEQPFEVESNDNLLVWAGRQLPPDAVGRAGLTNYLIAQARGRLGAQRPTDAASLARFREVYGEALAQTLYVQEPAAEELVAQEVGVAQQAGARVHRLTIGRKGVGDQVPALLWEKTQVRRTRAALLVYEGGNAALLAAAARPGSLVEELLGRGFVLLSIDPLLVGEHRLPEGNPPRGEGVQYFTTYNRTDTAERVQDILTALAYLKQQTNCPNPALVGQGDGGLWCLLARALATPTPPAALELPGFDLDSDEAYVTRLFVPGLRRAGGLETAAALGAPAPLLLHNLGDEAPPAGLSELYAGLDARQALSVRKTRARSARIADFVAGPVVAAATAAPG